MIAILFRFLSYVVLAGGVIIAIVDATRSVKAQQLQMTALGETLNIYMPNIARWLDEQQARMAGTHILNWPVSNLIDYLDAIPVALLAAALFLIIYGLASRNRAARHF